MQHRPASEDGDAPAPFPYRRICVVGTTGCGKSTLAAELARRLQIPHIELDALYWLPGWQHLEREIMIERVETVAGGESWVADGNYGFVRAVLWPRAQAIVWLDYPLTLILWRLWRRTWKRVLTRELLWGTNREKLVEQFFNKDSLFLWALKTYRRHRETYSLYPTLPGFEHLKVYRFISPSQTEEWLKMLITSQ